MFTQEQSHEIFEALQELKQRNTPTPRRRELLSRVSRLQSLRRQRTSISDTHKSIRIPKAAPGVNTDDSFNDFIEELKILHGHCNPLTVLQIINLSYLLTCGRLPNEIELEMHEKAATEGLALNASQRTSKDLFYDQIFYLMQSEEATKYLTSISTLSQSIDPEYSALIDRVINFVTGTTSFGGSRQEDIPNVGAILLEINSKKAFLNNKSNDNPSPENNVTNRLLSCWGCSNPTTLNEWVARLDKPPTPSQAREGTIIATQVQEVVQKVEMRKFWTGAVIKPESKVSIVCSLYRPEDYMDAFFEDISKQNAKHRCEYIILDIGNSSSTGHKIKAMAEKLPNHKYLRIEERIGIYEAWNIGIKISSHDLISNWNVDDFRHPSYFELSLSIFDMNPDLDILYSDCLYTYVPNLDWKKASLGGMATRYLNGVSDEFLRFNFFHNGPIWRRRLHDRYGLFNETLKSAGDYEFWLRCLKDPLNIYFIPLPLVGYYENPKGLSTDSENSQSVYREIEFAALSFSCNKILAQSSRDRDIRQSSLKEMESLYLLETGFEPLYQLT